MSSGRDDAAISKPGKFIDDASEGAIMRKDEQAEIVDKARELLHLWGKPDSWTAPAIERCVDMAVTNCGYTATLDDAKALRAAVPYADVMTLAQAILKDVRPPSGERVCMFCAQPIPDGLNCKCTDDEGRHQK